MKTTTCYLGIVLAGLLASCGDSQPPEPSVTVDAPSPELSRVIDAEPVGEVTSIHGAKQTAQPGDLVTIRGRVMGSESPFVEGRAAFILGDPEILTPCNEKPGDACTTPWDVCCDSPEDKKKGTATIQIVDSEGRVLKEGLEGVGGLENLATVTVSGKVAEGSSADRLVINAEAIRASE